MTPASETAPTSGFDPNHFQRLFDVEDEHFWFVARNRVLAAALSTLPRLTAPRPSILELGCGTGNTLRVLKDAFPSATLVGVDAFWTGLCFARLRGIGSLVQARIEHLPFRYQFDVIGMFDVLEHIEDDKAALGHVRALLRPGGALVITVPAGSTLWSRTDDEAHHRRRYEARGLVELLVASGFRLEYQTHFMAAIYPLVWLARRAHALRDRATRRRARPASAVERELKIVPGLNESLRWLLAPEAAWIASHRRLPFGTSLLAVART